jgi:hypothetical protein
VGNYRSGLDVVPRHLFLREIAPKSVFVVVMAQPDLFAPFLFSSKAHIATTGLWPQQALWAAYQVRKVTPNALDCLQVVPGSAGNGSDDYLVTDYRESKFHDRMTREMWPQSELSADSDRLLGTGRTPGYLRCSTSRLRQNRRWVAAVADWLTRLTKCGQCGIQWFIIPPLARVRAEMQSESTAISAMDNAPVAPSLHRPSAQAWNSTSPDHFVMNLSHCRARCIWPWEISETLVFILGHLGS